MSKGTIGTFLGAGIGFLIGGPVGAQVGALIGGAVGSSFDTIPGRKVGEMSSPRAQEGEPIPLVFGRARVTGRLMSCGEPDIRTESEGGKGGPKVENETAYLSYSILVCESSELRDSSIGGILMVIQNNKIVYDVRPNPAISAADSAKWKQNKVFYFGGEGQGVDPTEQMIHGAGNVPAYRGLCRMVVDDEDVTQHGGSVPTYEFVTSQCGVEGGGGGENTGSILVTGSPLLSGEPMFAKSPTGSTLSFTGIPQSSGATVPNGSPYYYEGAWVVHGMSSASAVVSTDSLVTWAPFTTDRVSTGYLAAGPEGLLVNGGGPASVYDLIGKANPIGSAVSSYAFSAEGPPGTVVFSHGEEAYMCRYAGGFYWIDVGAQGYLVKTTDISLSTQQLVYKRTGFEHVFLDIDVLDDVVYATTAAGKLISSPDGGASWSTVLAIGASAGMPLYLKAGNGILLVLARDCSTVWTSADSFAMGRSTGISGDTTLSPPVISAWGRGPMMAYASGWFYIVSHANTFTPALGNKCVSTQDGIAFGTPVSTGLDAVVGVAAADAAYTGEEIPDAPGYYIDPITGEVTGPTTVIEDTCPPITLQEIIDKLDARAGIPVANSVTTELADIEVPGYAIDSFLTVAEAKEPLRQVWFFDCPEWDDAIRYRLRGQATDFTIDPDDLIEGEDATEQGTRGQTVEYPKRLHVQYVDPVTGYKPMKQTAERISPDIRVKGELVAGANITLEADTAKQAADIGLKAAWTEREDSREFAIPVDYWPQAIAAHTFTLDGRRYRITELRLEAGAIYIKSVYDRISAYSSNATGMVGPAPTGPGTTIKGPTDSPLLNIPVLRDNDDKPGIYWAPRGYPDTAWNGAVLQVFRDGQWLQLDSTTKACNTGTLLADLPAYDGVVDETNTLQIRLSGGMDSITFAQFLNEGNPLAIQYPDGKAEILQAQFVTEVTSGVYDCTRLIRGRLDTMNGAHVAGAKVVFLNNNLRFIQLRSDDIGQTISFRAVSNGTDPSVAPVQTITLTTMESQREWQPWNVTVTKLPGCEYLITCIGRPRLGTDANPIQSQWWLGYRYDFTVDGITKSHLSQEQSFTYTAAMQVEDWGAVNCAGYIVSVASVNEYTGSDGGGGTGGGTPPAGLPNYPATIIGSPSDGYVGEPIFDALGPQYGAPFQAYGGLIEERFMGEIVGNVTCQSHAPGSGIMVGIPMTAETRNAATEMIPSGPLTGGGPFLITDSVTIAAKPTYSMMDESKPFGEKVLVTPVTVPARTTKRIGSVGLGGLKSRAGTSTAKVRCAFTVSHMPTGGRVFVGVVAAGENDHLAPGTGGSFAHMVTADGIYVVELDGATGAIEVFEIGVGSVATGTLPLTYAYDGKYRFAWVANDAQLKAAGAVIHTNMGNESWPDTPTAGYGGLLNAPSIIPCGFDAALGSANGYWLQGVSSLTGATRGGIHGGSLVYAYSEFGKSAGKWRIGMSGIETSRLGFCKAGHTGLIGSSGSADSIGFTDTRSPAGYIIETSFGGVFNRITVPQFFYYSNPLVYFAFDTDAGTLAIYVKVEVVAGDPAATYQLLTTLVGIPAGTWLPAANGIAQMTPEIPEPATFNNWTITR